MSLCSSSLSFSPSLSLSRCLSLSLSRSPPCFLSRCAERRGAKRVVEEDLYFLERWKPPARTIVSARRRPCACARHASHARAAQAVASVDITGALSSCTSFGATETVLAETVSADLCVGPLSHEMYRCRVRMIHDMIYMHARASIKCCGASTYAGLPGGGPQPCGSSGVEEPPPQEVQELPEGKPVYSRGLAR